MQFGIFSVGDVTTDPTTGRTPSEAERVKAMVTIALKAEEVGLDVDEVTYVGSEGWGSRAPGVLLTVFTARCADPQADPAVDGQEISAARFFPVDELPEDLPPAESIARRVIDSLR